MVRIRHGSPISMLGALALALSLVAGGGCKKDDKKSDPATADKTGDKPGDKLAEKPSGGPGTAAASGDDLALLPLDSQLVMGINVSQVQQSGLWKQFAEPKIMTGDAMKQLGDFKAKCGFDPMTAVKSMTIGFKGLSDSKPDGVIVVHGLDKAKTWACLDTMKDEMAKQGTELTKDGDVALIKSSKGGPPAAITFINDTTAVGVLGQSASAAGVKLVAAGGSTLKSSPPFLDMYSKVKTGDSLWALVNGSSGLLDKMSAIGVKPTAAFGSLNVTDGLSLDVHLRVESPEAATQLTTMSKSQLQQAAKMFDQADVTSEGSDVKYTIVLSSVKLKQLITQFSSMLGAFGGMGGQ